MFGDATVIQTKDSHDNRHEIRGNVNEALTSAKRFRGGFLAPTTDNFVLIFVKGYPKGSPHLFSIVATVVTAVAQLYPLGLMTSIVCAKSEWEAATVPHSCPRTRCKS